MSEKAQTKRSTKADTRDASDFEEGQFEEPGTPEHLGSEQPYAGAPSELDSEPK